MRKVMNIFLFTFHIIFTGDFHVAQWRRKWQSPPVLLPGKSHGQRSLVGCSLWGRKELDTTERLHFTSVGKESACNPGDSGDTSSIPGSRKSPGWRHGNPLQYSCLENPIDRGARRLQSIASQKVGRNWRNWACRHAWYVRNTTHHNQQHTDSYFETDLWTMRRLCLNA